MAQLGDQPDQQVVHDRGLELGEGTSGLLARTGTTEHVVDGAHDRRQGQVEQDELREGVGGTIVTA